MAGEATNTERISFENPPLNEVVFSVQFESDVIDEVGILARFLGEVEDRYPRLEKQPPVPPATETFDQPPQPPIQFQLLSGPPSHRYWFLSPDGTLIVQVQADRLMFNWRQVQGDEQYPRYETLCPEFVRLLGLFVDSLPDGVDAKPAWCELQYINPIPVALFRSLGFDECFDGVLRPDMEKIAIYGNDDEFEHVAFQRADGSWSSKLGELGDIRHDRLDSIAGPGFFEYSAVVG